MSKVWESNREDVGYNTREGEITLMSKEEMLEWCERAISRVNAVTDGRDDTGAPETLVRKRTRERGVVGVGDLA